MTFKRGDKVEYKNGDSFSNGSLWVTVDRVVPRPNSKYGDQVWLEETNTHALECSLQLRTIEATDRKEVLRALEMKLEDARIEKRKAENEFDRADALIKDLMISIKIVKELS